MHVLARRTGLIDAIDEKLHLLEVHLPYHESDHVLNIAYKGEWGYHPLVVSLANTGEPLFWVNRSGSQPSHEGAAQRFDQSIDLCRRAGRRTA